MSKQCVTHHFACDCREERFKLLELENNALRVRLEILAINSKKQTEELERKVADQGLTIATIQDIVTNDNRSNKAKVLAIGYVLRKEAQP